jgi:Trypsin-like peptidase domain
VPVVPLSARVVEVIADLGEAARPRYRYGSGCVVAGRTVLTAAHVMEGAVGVKVRDSAKVMHEAALDPVFVGDVNGPRPDLAPVEITALEIDMPAMSLAAVDRNSVSGDPVERCHAVGYPAFMERRTPAGDPFRESVDAFGYVPVLSFLATGLLSVQVSSAPRELPPEQTKLRHPPLGAQLERRRLARDRGRSRRRCSRISAGKLPLDPGARPAAAGRSGQRHRLGRGGDSFRGCRLRPSRPAPRRRR